MSSYTKVVGIVFVLALVYLLTGCCTIKGAAHDIAWTADKIDEAIIVPE